MTDYKVPDSGEKIYIEKNKMNSAFDMPTLHSHKCNELYFLLSGQRRYFIGHSIYDVSPGNIVIIPGHELHRTAALNSRASERYMVYFYDEYLTDIIQSVGIDAYEGFLRGECFQLPPERTEKIRKNLEAMEQEFSGKDTYSYAMLRNIFQNIVLSVLRYGKRKQCETGEGTDKIQEVARYISENYASDITLKSAAKMAFMEETYFSKRFKHITGFGFNEYLIKTRIKAAEELLSFSELSIGEISERYGFSSSNYFGDVFKRWKGVSPSEYRKNGYGI